MPAFAPVLRPPPPLGGTTVAEELGWLTGIDCVEVPVDRLTPLPLAMLDAGAENKPDDCAAFDVEGVLAGGVGDG